MLTCPHARRRFGALLRLPGRLRQPQVRLVQERKGPQGSQLLQQGGDAHHAGVRGGDQARGDHRWAQRAGLAHLGCKQRWWDQGDDGGTRGMAVGSEGDGGRTKGMVVGSGGWWWEQDCMVIGPRGWWWDLGDGGRIRGTVVGPGGWWWDQGDDAITVQQGELNQSLSHTRLGYAGQRL